MTIQRAVDEQRYRKLQVEKNSDLYKATLRTGCHCRDEKQICKLQKITITISKELLN